MISSFLNSSDDGHGIATGEHILVLQDSQNGDVQACQEEDDDIETNRIDIDQLWKSGSLQINTFNQWIVQCNQAV